MEIKKKHIIYFIVTVCFCIASFCYGRYRSRTDKLSGELESRIVLTRDTAIRLLDELGITGYAGASSAKYGQAIVDGIGKLCETNKKLRVFTDDIIAEVDYTTKNAEIINNSLSGVSDAIDYGWQLVIEESQSFERIAERTRAFNENIIKNSEKPE